MPSTIPIIRAGAVAPFLRWMREQGREADACLSRSALDDYPTDDALAPIPFRGAVMLLREIVDADGADAPFRVVETGGFHELGLLSRLAIAGRTPHQVLKRIRSAMRFHCSHEFLELDDRGGFLLIRHGLQLNLSDTVSAHAVQQYVLAVLGTIFSMTGIAPPYFDRIQMVPHPEQGFTHLPLWTGDGTEFVAGRVFEVTVSSRLAERPLAGVEICDPAEPAAPEHHRVLKTDGTVSESVAFLVESMMRKTKPTVERVARSAGTSRRTLQRAIASEGTDFSSILENVRRAHASKILAAGNVSMSELSDRLGYAHQATLSRALRRWSKQSDGRTTQAGGGEHLI